MDEQSKRRGRIEGRESYGSSDPAVIDERARHAAAGDSMSEPSISRRGSWTWLVLDAAAARPGATSVTVEERIDPEAGPLDADPMCAKADVILVTRLDLPFERAADALEQIARCLRQRERDFHRWRKHGLVWGKS